MSESNEYDTAEDAADDNKAATNQIVRRGFDGVQLAGDGPASQALVAKATADIQSRWIMAMKNPRNVHQVRALLKKECTRPSFAKAAIYSVPRGGARIEGLSIRFAEAAMRISGNMSCEAQTLFEDDEQQLIRITATDFETNATWMRDIKVPKTIERKQLKSGQRPIRTRINSQNEPVYLVEATDDDIAMKAASAISKASRTAILRLIPGNVLDEMKELCKRTMNDAAARDPDGERRQIIDAFAGMSIMPEQLEEYLDHSIDQTAPQEIVELRFLFVSLRDGDTNWGEIRANMKERRAAMKKLAADQIAAKAAAAAASAPAGSTPTPAPTSATQPSASQSAKPAATTQPADRKTGGKGTSAVKDKIEQAKKASAPAVASEATKPMSAPEMRTTPEPAPDIKPAPKADAPADHAEPTAAPDDVKPDESSVETEIRSCFLCRADIEVPVTTKTGATCSQCDGEWPQV